MTTQPTPSDSLTKDRLVNSILDLEIPFGSMQELVSQSLHTNAKLLSLPTPSMNVEQVVKRKAELQAMTLEDLQGLHASLKAAKDRRDEAARFYNQANAMADFGYWLSMDFWTLDEAIALLVGRNPSVVTWEAVHKVMHPPKKFLAPAPVSTPFLQLFERLRLAAQRSEVMTSSAKLKPLVVAEWGQGKLGKHLPAQLQALLASAKPKDESATQTAPVIEPTGDASDKPVLVKRKALTAMVNVWPTVESDLRHAGENGLQAAAKASQHGMWKEKEALEWARQNAKKTDTAPAPNTPAYRSSVFHQTK